MTPISNLMLTRKNERIDMSKHNGRTHSLWHTLWRVFYVAPYRAVCLTKVLLRVSTRHLWTLSCFLFCPSPSPSFFPIIDPPQQQR